MRTTAFVLVLLLTLPACTSWRAASTDAVPTAESNRVRVTTTAGSRYVLTEGSVRGDSLYGRTDAGAEVAIALADLERAETRRFSVVRTAGAVAGGVALAGVLYIGAIVVYLLSGGSFS